MNARPMLTHDERDVRALYNRCHPGKPARPPHWYFAHPTLVLECRDKIVGVTSFTLSPTTRGYVGYGCDLFVHPDYRRRGYGRRLAETRVAIARSLGAVDFVGMTTPDNAPMVSILTRQGLREQATTPDGAVYIGSIA